MKQKLLIVCIAVLTVVAIVFGSLYFSNNAEKNQTIDALTGEKAKLADDVAGKAEKISALESEKNQLVTDHTAAIEGKDGEIAVLQGEKDQLIADHAAAIESKDGEIAALEETVKNKEDEIGKLTADHEKAMQDKEAEIEKLSGEKDQLIADYAAAIEGKDGEIAALQGEKDQLIADHEKAIKEKDDEIQQLKDDSAKVLAEKDSLIAELKAEAEYLQKLVTVPVVEPVEETVIEAVEESAVLTSYAEYAAAPVDTFVVVETYVQAKQSWWDNRGTFYTQNEEGAYFLYEMAISEEDYNKLVPGTKIRVTGYKAEWAGEVEIVDATFEILEGEYIAEAKDLTNVLGTDELINYQNQFAAFKGMTVEAIEYKNGEPGDDIYVTLSLNGASYSFCVERYFTDPETEVYQTVGTLHAGDIVDVEGFLYWYNGANAHITGVTVVACHE